MYFVSHTFATSPELPAKGAGLYEYVVGANGVFVRAERPGLSALIWIDAFNQPIRGLSDVQPFVRVDPPVPALLVARMFEMAYRSGNREILFYLAPNPWRILVPEQVQGGASVHPVDPFVGKDALIEVHSHHSMGCFFSGQDDAEERAGFRVYAVLGNLARKPSILVRVGVYGHFWQIPAAWVFALPAGTTDALYEIPEREGEYEPVY